MSHSPTVETNENIDDYSRAWKRLNRLVRAGETWSGHERNCGFLNLGGKRFANISAVTGIDFPDDGRCMALVDWDHDGDTDVWITNRSAPRVRFLRNDLSSEHHFLAVRLEGKTCNRDAIGARVEVFLKNADDSRLVNALRAGEGFRGQSSKWIHFGLGKSTSIERVEVRWPGGQAETFTGIEPDKHFRLVQGSGQAMAWEPPARTGELSPSTVTPPKPTAVARTVLLHRTPLPQLHYETMEKDPSLVSDKFGKPLLLNLWSLTCLPCRAELKHWTERESDVRAAGLNILAISVDDLEGSDESVTNEIKRALENLSFPFATGKATSGLVDRLQLVVDGLFGRDVPLSVPISILIDREGDLAAIYRGSVELDQIIADVNDLSLSGEKRRKAVTPLPGRWIDPYSPDSYLVTIAGALESHGNRKEAFAYVQRNIEKAKRDTKYGQMLDEIGNRLHAQGRLEEAAGKYREAIAADPRLATPHVNLGLIHLKNKRFAEAVAAYRNALDITPDDFEIHFHIGNALRTLRNSAEAIRHLRRSTELKPSYYQAHFLLATLLAAQNEFEDAAKHFQQTLEIKPGLHQARFAMGFALLRNKESADGIAHIRQAAVANPKFLIAINNNAWRLATHPDPDVRSVDVALQLAEVGAALTEHRQATYLDTLAVAQAAAGQFEQAVATAENGISLAEAAGQAKLSGDILSRLEIYRQGKAYLERPAKP